MHEHLIFFTMKLLKNILGITPVLPTINELTNWTDDELMKFVKLTKSICEGLKIDRDELLNLAIGRVEGGLSC
jgi:hypothetical protein